MMLNKTANFWLLFLICFVGINITQCYTANSQIISEPENEIGLSNSEIIDNWTEHFFELLRPELKGKEIQAEETLYQREKAAIAQVVTYVLFSSCQQQQRNYYFFLADQETDNKQEYLGGNNFNWRQNKNYFFEGFYQDLTNAIFYTRHPEISLKEDKSRHLNLVTEWNLIRRHFANYNQEELLKKYLVPVCNES